MGQLAQQRWREYRDLLMTEEPDFDAALDASKELEDACAREKEGGVEDADAADEQLLAGAAIDYLVAGELALIDAELVDDAPPAEERAGVFREAVAAANAAFGLDAGDGLDSPAPVAGAAFGPPAKQLRDNCFATADELFREAAPAVERGAMALADPIGDLAGWLDDVVLPKLPASVSALAAEAARRARRAIKALMRAVRKVLRAADLDPDGGLVDLALPEILTEVVAKIREAAVELLLHPVASRGTFEDAVIDALDDKSPSADGLRDAADENDELARRFARRLLFVRVMVRAAGWLVSALLVVAAPFVPAVAGAIPLAYAVYLLRSRLETLPDRLQRFEGIPSIARKYA